jgi:hypothetical protein
MQRHGALGCEVADNVSYAFTALLAIKEDPRRQGEKDSRLPAYDANTGKLAALPHDSGG